MGKLIIDGNSVYEVDEECLKKRGLPEKCEALIAYQKEKERKEKRSR